MQNENNIIVNVEHLHKIFYSIRGYWRQKKHPVEAVKDISFSICKGELFGMVGPNGAGKTTTVKMLSTLLLPTSGSNWTDIQSLFLGELLIGFVYISIGYMMFIWFEKISLVDGQIETV